MAHGLISKARVLKIIMASDLRIKSDCQVQVHLSHQSGDTSFKLKNSENSQKLMFGDIPNSENALGTCAARNV